ncbi:MAG: DUF447 domain-containing protein [Vicinamibacterales bacterium]
MILETIVTTVSADGAVNCAPMGVEWGEETIVLKPFLDTATYRNVAATGTAVVNLVDDARVFAETALASRVYPTEAAQVVAGAVLVDCCSWRELRRTSVDATPPRARIEMRVVHAGVRREFIGFNRARHAVLEATIYATRIHLLEPEFIASELTRLQVIVDKTAGPEEREAMAFVSAHVRTALASRTSRS